MDSKKLNQLHSHQSPATKSARYKVDQSKEKKTELIKKPIQFSNILSRNVSEPIWVSVSEAAKLGGVTDKTIRRAIASNHIKFKVVKDRYSIDLASVIKFLYNNTKLKNKFKQSGLGQYVEKWE